MKITKKEGEYKEKRKKRRRRRRGGKRTTTTTTTSTTTGGEARGWGVEGKEKDKPRDP